MKKQMETYVEIDFWRFAEFTVQGLGLRVGE